MPPRASPTDQSWQLRTIGNRLSRAKRHREAIAALRAALALDPGSAAAHNDLGAARHRAGRLDEAIGDYQRALALDPSYAKAHSNLGAAHMDRNEPELAAAAYRRALALSPRHAKIQTNLAFAQLVQGDLLSGWRNFEHRWAAGMRMNPHLAGRTPWRGERPLKGRSILLCAEQGFGDLIQFARYIPLVAAMGARVHLETKPELRRLFAASFPEVAAVYKVGETVPRCDECCTVPSLPLAFKTELGSIPARVPYLRAPEGAAAEWSGLGPSPRIGLAWSGDPNHHNDRNRSIPFERFRTAIAGRAGTFVSLQAYIRPSDRPALAASNVADVSARLKDFASTAALVESIDLVIAVDTSVAHLAGALGKPTWVLVPYAPDWRWMLGRADSPWYPTVRLFRQPRPGDWDSVLQQIRAELPRAAL